VQARRAVNPNRSCHGAQAGAALRPQGRCRRHARRSPGGIFSAALANLNPAREDEKTDRGILNRLVLASLYETHGPRDALKQIHDRIERLHQKIDRIERKIEACDRCRRAEPGRRRS